MTLNRIASMLCKRFCKPETPRPFTTLRHRSGQHLRLVLQKQYPNANIRIADRDYSCPTRKEFETWIQKDCVSEKTYQNEWRDCDDYAHAIVCRMFAIGQEYKTSMSVAYCEGFVDNFYHAFCIFIDDTDRIFVVEPQDDHVVPAEDSSYTADFIQL